MITELLKKLTETWESLDSGSRMTLSLVGIPLAIGALFACLCSDYALAPIDGLSAEVQQIVNGIVLYVSLAAGLVVVLLFDEIVQAARALKNRIVGLEQHSKQAIGVTMASLAVATTSDQHLASSEVLVDHCLREPSSSEIGIGAALSLGLMALFYSKRRARPDNDTD